MSFGLFFVLLALVLFLVAGFNVPVPRVSLIALGLASLTLGAFLLPALGV